MSLCVVFSIVLLDVNRVSALTLVGSGNNGSIEHVFDSVWSGSDSSFYSEQTYTYRVMLNTFLSCSKYYLISGGVDTVFTNESVSNYPMDYSVDVGVCYYYNGKRYYGFNNVVFAGNNNDNFQIEFTVKTSVFPHLSSGTLDWVATYVIPKIRCNYRFDVYELDSNEIAGFVGQSGVVGSIDRGNDLQEKGNQLQQEANETSKGILGKITDFFGSFFAPARRFSLYPSCMRARFFALKVTKEYGRSGRF